MFLGCFSTRKASVVDNRQCSRFILPFAVASSKYHSSKDDRLQPSEKSLMGMVFSGTFANAPPDIQAFSRGVVGGPEQG